MHVSLSFSHFSFKLFPQLFEAIFYEWQIKHFKWILFLNSKCKSDDFECMLYSFFTIVCDDFDQYDETPRSFTHSLSLFFRWKLISRDSNKAKQTKTQTQPTKWITIGAIFSGVTNPLFCVFRLQINNGEKTLFRFLKIFWCVRERLSGNKLARHLRKIWNRKKNLLIRNKCKGEK